MRKEKISPELLKKLKDSINILEVIGEHVVLKKSGANYFGICPFHAERTPSFSVSESKQLYHCYGCKRGGDLVTFVMDILGISFIEAVEELADRARVSLPSNWKSATPSNSDFSEQKKQQQSLAFKLNRFAAAFFHQNLSHSSRGLQYFQTRGISPELMRNFYLGAATDSWDSLSQHLMTRKAPIDLALELGLIRPSVKSPKGSPSVGYFDLFRSRVIFPILNLKGKIAGFGGRAYENESPKYLNSSESFIFQKSKLAFGLFQAQKYIREKDEIILVEGYFDALALHMAGFQNTVATCGTALTLDHLNLFKRFANKLTVLFDGDQAGMSATERAMEVGLNAGWVIFGSQMPSGMDPDELILSSSLKSQSGLGKGLDGKEEMAAILKEAKPLLDSKIDEMILSVQKNSGDSECLTQAIKKMGSWLVRFQDPIGKEIRIQNIEKKLGISRKILQQAMESRAPLRLNQGKKSHEIQSIQFPSKTTLKQSDLRKNQNEQKIGGTDRVLLTGIVMGGSCLQILTQAKNELPTGALLQDLWNHEGAQNFVGKLLSKPDLIEKLKNAPDRLWDELREEGGLDASVQAIITGASLSENPLIDLEDFKGAVFRSLYRLWARFSQRIRKSIAEADAKNDANLQERWMKEYLDVQRKMKEFSSFYDEE